MSWELLELGYDLEGDSPLSEPLTLGQVRRMLLRREHRETLWWFDVLSSQQGRWDDDHRPARRRPCAAEVIDLSAFCEAGADSPESFPAIRRG